MKAVLSGCQELRLDTLLQHIQKNLFPGPLCAEVVNLYTALDSLRELSSYTCPAESHLHPPSFLAFAPRLESTDLFHYCGVT